MTISAQDTLDIFIGSGALGFPWYRVDEHPADNIDADTWTLAFTEFAFGSAETEISQHVITHDDVLRAVRKIASGGAHQVEDVVQRECQALLSQGPDVANRDAEVADVVIQVATFGKVLYG
ncbi:hypothetical protein [Saccharopolyspora mangrovi]|uniref:DUF3168 domain-containing protein n=1 Tax=Saccharopolyspora mangrovi TaxID=3082379 RepID=A0ABU6AE87_9PSEU|nr:hypothetical protein [Saccharopolyspora sp. S2-29]MEB3369766.1 hypothetical protein [Saccharopolyspora sp. S2-29]